MTVTNGYGRSMSDPSLYRLSSSGQTYSFQTYACMYYQWIAL